LESKVRDSSGISGTGETIQGCKATRVLTARPAESEHPGTEINHFQESNKVYERKIQVKKAKKSSKSKIKKVEDEPINILSL
jgi:hypothetical protein